jgi:hypothetical protein
MQTVSRYLLSNMVIAYINGYHGRNSKVYDRQLKIYKGVSNPITFTFKNEDQKSQFVDAKTFEFNLIDTDTQQSVLTRNLTILDDGSSILTKGRASVTLTEGDLLGLDAKFYSYSIREVATDGSRTVTFTDTAYNSAGTAEVLAGGYPQFADSESIINFTKSGSTSTSSAIDARPGMNDNSALHTVAVYPVNFAGTLVIQGTMVSTAPTDADYFEISSNAITTTDTIAYYNFTGVLQYVRFRWTNDSGNTGVIDKILYRQ